MRYQKPLIAVGLIALAALLPDLAFAAPAAAGFDPTTSGKAFDLMCGTNGVMAGAPGCGSPGVMAAMFTTYNASIMAVAVVWLTWTIMAGAAQTAHDGEFLGKRFSSLWSPIRIVVGAASIVPVANGFNLAQIIMVWAALTGSTIADKVWESVLGGLGSGAFTMGVSPPPPVNSGAFPAMMRMVTCREGITKSGADLSNAFTGSTFTSAGVIQYGKMENGSFQALCGTITPGGPRGAADAAEIASITESVLTPVAINIVNGSRSEDVSGAIAKAEAQFDTYLQAAFTSSPDAATNANQLTSALGGPGGWVDAGVWYQTLAVKSNKQAAASAPQAVAKSMDGGGAEWGASLDSAAVALQSLDNQTQKVQTKDPKEAAIDALKDGNMTGFNKLMGGWLSGWIIKGTANSLTTGDTSTTGSPIMQVKNIGDYMIDSGWVIAGAYITAEMLDGAERASLIGKGVNLLTGVGGAIHGLLAGSSPIINAIIFALFFGGAMMAVYVPLIPFINWVAGLIQLLVIYIEALVAAPLWAMVHMDTEGDGMGQRTTYGYLFLLNVLFRPVLMIFGFVAGALIVWLIGGYVDSNLANALFNANTEDSGQATFGLISMIAALFVYMSLMIMLINSSFQLPHVIADKVLNWVGGQFHYSNNDAAGMRGEVSGGMGKLSGVGQMRRMGKDPKPEVPPPSITGADKQV